MGEWAIIAVEVPAGWMDIMAGGRATWRNMTERVRTCVETEENGGFDGWMLNVDADVFCPFPTT